METPPPFVHRENAAPAAGPVAVGAPCEPAAVQPEPASAGNPVESAASSASSDATSHAVAALGITGDVAERIEELLRNAEAEGYLRGRNAQIEATQHFEPDPDLDPAPASLPHYHASTLWDIG